MISKETIAYLTNRATKDGVALPDNFIEILTYYCNMIEDGYGYKLIFNANGMNPQSLDGDAGLPGSKKIHITPEWAAQLVLCDTEEVRNTFKATLGHELTHKDKEPFPMRFGLKRTKLYANVREVHADFGGAQKMCNSSKFHLWRAMNFKKYFKEQTLKKKDQNSYTTPQSWSARMSYLDKCKFDRALIQRIADQLECGHKKKWIDHLCTFFDDIVLVDDMSDH
jgi:hypothetical protein